jgi:hypothetical protein
MGYKAGQKRLIQSLQQKGVSSYFTVAATYLRDGRLSRKGVFLQDHSGKIIGQQIEDVHGQEECDGCAVLSYRDGLKFIHPIENVFSIPGLPYPVILEDSGTVEGRAIDLFTFDKEGRASEYRQYEYMVTCVLGPDPNVTPPKQF